jgi:hypothetical protein
MGSNCAALTHLVSFMQQVIAAIVSKTVGGSSSSERQRALKKMSYLRWCALPVGEHSKWNV